MLARLDAANFRDKLPIDASVKYSRALNEFITFNSLTLNTSTIFVWSALSSYKVHGGRITDSTSSAITTNVPVIVMKTSGGTNVEQDITATIDPAANDTEYTAQVLDYAKVSFGSDNALMSILELVAANQVSELADENIQSFFAAKGTELNIGLVRKVVRYISSVEGSLMSSSIFQARSLDFKWMAYHTTAASGSGLVMRFLDMTGASKGDGNYKGGIFSVTEATYDLVVQSIRAPWEITAADRIPDRIKGFAYIFLEAMDLLPKNKWYQGLRASSNLSPNEILAIKAAASKHKALTSATTGISAATDADTLTKAIDASGIGKL